MWATTAGWDGVTGAASGRATPGAAVRPVSARATMDERTACLANMMLLFLSLRRPSGSADEEELPRAPCRGRNAGITAAGSVAAQGGRRGLPHPGTAGGGARRRARRAAGRTAARAAHRPAAARGRGGL